MTRAVIIVVSLVTAAILITISAGSFLKFLRGGPALHLETARVHYYGDPSTPIERIKIKAVYFVPKERRGNIFTGWSSVLPPALEEMGRFHTLQFRSRSKISYEIHPEVIIGEKSASFYDSPETRKGNPFAAKRIDEETTRRLPDFFRAEPGEFLSKIYIYEGVGASAVGNAIIFSRDFLSQSSYESTHSSILYHELGHTLGMPEGYDVETNIPSTFDVMGEGRFKPLRITYIADGTKAAMGLK